MQVFKKSLVYGILRTSLYRNFGASPIREIRRFPFQLIAANIVADVVITLSRSVPDFLEPQGVYIISGIIDSREEDVLAALEGRFEIIERREERGWVAMALRQYRTIRG